MTKTSWLLAPILSLVLFLAGCASLPPYDEFTYANSVVRFDQGESGFVAFIKELQEQKGKVVLLKSPNTVKTLQFLKKKREESFIAELSAQDFDELYFEDRLVYAFKGLAITVEKPASSNPESVVGPAIEVDIRVRLGNYSFDTTTFELSLIGIDKNGQLVGTMQRTGKATLGVPAWTFAVRPATMSAIDQVLAALMAPAN